MLILDPLSGQTIEIAVSASTRRLEERAARKAARLAEKAQARSRISALVAETAATPKIST